MKFRRSTRCASFTSSWDGPAAPESAAAVLIQTFPRSSRSALSATVFARQTLLSIKSSFRSAPS